MVIVRYHAWATQYLTSSGARLGFGLDEVCRWSASSSFKLQDPGQFQSSLRRTLTCPTSPSCESLVHPTKQYALLVRLLRQRYASKPACE
jgi:hypothetical protein